MAVLAVPVAFVALVSVAFVALVRKDAHDHAIWTGDVLVEAPAIENVVVIAHAIHFQLLLFPSHQELGAIVVEVQANLAVQEAQEAPEVCQEHQEEHQDHQRR